VLDERLDSDERRSLLFLLVSVALADGKLTETEVRFVQRLALPIGAGVGDILAQLDSEPLDAHFDRLRARPLSARIAIVELLRIAHVDGIYAHVEQTTIYSYARRLRVPDQKVVQLEEWVEREWRLEADGKRLVEVG
jgi:uncharacterized tellurite resistance protein B-like protein